MQKRTTKRKEKETTHIHMQSENVSTCGVIKIHKSSKINLSYDGLRRSL
jgi:hypothetical protein